MFYSHTFLARKGPLGTVWCAAHLQNRLRKSHYLATDVISTVERIMYPEVPIALRMSGHLLLGVVRVYSRQVEYFYEDCNAIQRAVNRDLRSVTVNLPEASTRALVESVTLPGNFQLDSVELDDNAQDRPENPHVKMLADITLTDQIPTGNDPYIGIDITEQGEDLGAVPVPMDEDAPNNGVEEGGTKFIEYSPGVRLNSPNIGNARSPQGIPSIEVMRDAGNDIDFNVSPILPDRAEPDEFLVEELNRESSRGGTPPVAAENFLSPVRDFASPHINEDLPSSAHLGSLVQKSPEEPVIQRTPVFQVARRKKRKHHFDRSIILSNECMRNNLEDVSDLIRKKGDVPTSALGIWRRNKRLRMRKEGIFVESYLNGACPDLQGLYNIDFVLPARFHDVLPEETQQNHQEMNNNYATHADDDRDVEIEIRPNEFPPFQQDHQEMNTTHVDDHDAEIEIPQNEFPPFLESHFSGENSEIPVVDWPMQEEQTILPEVPEMVPSPGLSSLHIDVHEEQAILPEVPETLPSPGELGFLDHHDDNSPTRSQGTPSRHPSSPQPPRLSSRTRAVGEYLRKKSFETPLGEDGSHGDLCLNKILEGKPRKICARMFYETLVLKSYGLVEVHQDKPYDDIVLKVDQNSLKEQEL